MSPIWQLSERQIAILDLWGAPDGQFGLFVSYFTGAKSPFWLFHERQSRRFGYFCVTQNTIWRQFAILAPWRLPDRYFRYSAIAKFAILAIFASTRSPLCAKFAISASMRSPDRYFRHWAIAKFAILAIFRQRQIANLPFWLIGGFQIAVLDIQQSSN